VERDKAAVQAGLTWWINNGVVEGLVTKVKLIKRQMYGRASFAHLASTGSSCPLTEQLFLSPLGGDPQERLQREKRVQKQERDAPSAFP